MPNEWSLRDEILQASQRWPWLALFCLLGALLGWLIAYLIPTPIRATRELYVGLNVYRAMEDRSVAQYAGIELVNANDYKNWQMDSLNSLILMDAVIGETLAHLQQLDPYWKTTPASTLADSLHVYWRNAGKWRLVAEHRDPRRAAEVVTIWQDVVLEHVHQAVLESQSAMVLEFQLRALAEKRSTLLERAILMKQIRQRFTKFDATLADRSQAEPPDSAEYWEMWRTLAHPEIDSSLEPLLDSFPSEGAPIAEFRTWIQESLPTFDQELATLESQIQEMLSQEDQTASQFAEASRKSFGLSATLDVDKISESRTEQIRTRPTGTLMLAGSLLGLITWLASWFISISLRGRE